MTALDIVVIALVSVFAISAVLYGFRVIDVIEWLHRKMEEEEEKTK